VFFEVNPLFREVARRNNYFGFTETDLWKKVEANHKSVRGIKEIPEAVPKFFATSHDVAVPFHVQIQAAFQTHTDNAVSKTINMPHHRHPGRRAGRLPAGLRTWDARASRSTATGPRASRC
jgi:ribonucleotide reductase alpha subunit